MTLVLVFYISGHGFGHATRNLEVIRQILEKRRDVHIVIRSSVPRPFLERSLPGTVDLQLCETDTGVVQIDSLQIDEEETARRADSFYRNFAARVENEAEALNRLDARLVVGDIPPLAFAAAARAGLPSIAVANFTWDWIYESYPRFEQRAPGTLTTMRRAYATASLALRLPFSGGFHPMRTVTRDVPLIARRSRRNRDSTRRILNLDGLRPVILVSLGGHGATLPFDEIARQNDATLVVTDHELAEGRGDSADGRLRHFTREALASHDLRYEDLVAAADIVVSKPGYGIVSECIANEVALLYTSRGPFAEQEVLVAGMQPVLRCRFIPQEELRAGHWGAAIRALLDQSTPTDRMPMNGAAVVAEAILNTKPA